MHNKSIMSSAKSSVYQQDKTLVRQNIKHAKQNFIEMIQDLENLKNLGRIFYKKAFLYI